jgi:hypothetical protein
VLVFLQHENEKALQKLKEAQAEAREQSRIMTEENAMLAAQLAKLQNFASDHQSSNFFLCPISAEDALHDALAREAKLKEQLAHVDFSLISCSMIEYQLSFVLLYICFSESGKKLLEVLKRKIQCLA